ncbi:hypothetical protein AAFF_G00197900 [Aldrovandia affinis]|uniref:Gypsy retrotransposon integrase-like protein 1 n=1 Tax=Aldrovandia affinis TaxID=143900 RepID=A0AAD7RI76_9TELE|nr:hypothetical protein AAFF_G00197900 [Aldrovandia affinis]
MEVPTLALVVPDMCNVSQILIGTNTLVLYTLSFQEKGVCKPSSHGYQAVMKILEARRKHTDTDALGWAKMQGSNPEVIPAGHTVVIDAFIHVNGAITESFQSEGEHGLPVIPHMTEKELRERQQADLNLIKVISYLEDGETPPPLPRKEAPEVAILLREWNRLELRTGVLNRRKQSQDTTINQLVLPREMRTMVLRSLYDDIGHLGIERTTDLVRS